MAEEVTSLRLSIDSREVKTAQKELDKLSSSSNKTEKSAKSLSLGFGALSSVIAGISIGALTKQFIDSADAMTNVNNQLKLVTNSTEELASAQKELFTIAQRTRQDYAATAGVYSNFALSMGEMGKSQKDILRVTETVNKAIAISGGTAQQAAAATMQLGQAFASGTLRGDELNSILENSKGLAQAIADGMGVSIGKLRQLGADGKITAEILATALERSADSVDKKFGKTTATVEQSMTQMRNQISRSIEEFDKMNGVSYKVSSSIQGFTKYLSENGDALDNMSRYMKDAIVLGGTLYGSVLAVETISAISRAMKGLTLAQYAFNLAAKANPYIIAGTAVAGAATFMYDQMQQSQDEFDKKIKKSTDSQEAYNKTLTTTEGKANSLANSYVALNKSLEALQKQRGGVTGEKAIALDKAIASTKSNIARVQKELDSVGKKSTSQAKLSPLVDTTAKAKKGKKEKTAEELRKEDHDLAQSKLKDIQKIADGQKRFDEDRQRYQDEQDQKDTERNKKEFAGINKMTADRMKAEDEVAKKREQELERFKIATIDMGDVAINAAYALEDALVDAFMTGKLNAQDMFRAIAADLARLAIRQAVTAPLMGGVSSLFASADGNAFSGSGKVQAFADGGAFTNSVVSKPTTAPMALFGEAGPEAIMPLQRTSDGKLGVVATGVPSQNIKIEMINQSGQELQTTQSEQKFNGEQWVIGVVIDAARRNRSGMRDVLRGGQ